MGKRDGTTFDMIICTCR